MSSGSARSMSVSMPPGTMVLTRIVGARVTAAVRVIICTAALLTE